MVFVVGCDPRAPAAPGPVRGCVVGGAALTVVGQHFGRAGATVSVNGGERQAVPHAPGAGGPLQSPYCSFRLLLCIRPAIGVIRAWEMVRVVVLGYGVVWETGEGPLPEQRMAGGGGGAQIPTKRGSVTRA